MTIRPLTKARIAKATPRKKIYIIRDKKLKGFHLQVLPTDSHTIPSPISASTNIYATQTLRQNYGI